MEQEPKEESHKSSESENSDSSFEGNQEFEETKDVEDDDQDCTSSDPGCKSSLKYEDKASENNSSDSGDYVADKNNQNIEIIEEQYKTIQSLKDDNLSLKSDLDRVKNEKSELLIIENENRIKYEGQISFHKENAKKYEEKCILLEKKIENDDQNQKSIISTLEDQIKMNNEEVVNYSNNLKQLQDKLINNEKEKHKLNETNRYLEINLKELSIKNESQENKISELIKKIHDSDEKLNRVSKTISEKLGYEIKNENEIFIAIDALKNQIEDNQKTIKLLELKNNVLEEMGSLIQKIKASATIIKNSPWELEKIVNSCKEHLQLYENNESTHFEIKFTKDIWYSENNPSNFLKNIEISKVFSLIGSSQSGKTFILSKLSNSVQKLGKEFPTKGLQFDHFEINETSFLSIDSEGLFQPVPFNSLDFKEKLLKEQLMTNIVISMSKTIILVVNNFDLYEQKMLADSLNRTSKSNKNFLVVHNFKDLYDPKELPEIWKNEMFQLYGKHLSERSLQKVQKMNYENKETSNIISVFFMKNSCSKKGVTHVGIINDNYKIGKDYNEFAFEFIKKTLVYENLGKPMNDFESFIRRKVKKCTGIEIEIQNKRMNLANFNNSFEFLEFMNHNWSKSADMFKKFVDMKISEDEFVVSVDFPGESDDIWIKTLNGITSVTSNRPDDQSQLKRDSKRRFGNSILDFKIPKRFNHLQPQAKIMNGILNIVYKPFEGTSIKVTCTEDI